MRLSIALFLAALSLNSIAKAQSSLLESVKQNPEEARSLCRYFRSLNTKGKSAISPEVISEIAKKRDLKKIEAEILTTYVIGMNCPDVR